MLHLQLLGSPLVRIGTANAKFVTQRSLALLAYFSIEQRADHRRASLLLLFYPEVSEAKGRQQLSTELSRLRRALGEAASVVTATRQTVGILSDAALENDYHTFVNLIAQTEQHSHEEIALCAPCQARLTQAVGLVRGELLAGLDVKGSEGFEEWLLLERARIDGLYLDALYALAEGALGRGESGLAADYARRQIAREGWRETAHRQLIKALMQKGELNAALAHYQTCRQLLREELGVEPSAATQQLIERVKRTINTPVAESSQVAMVTNNLPSNLTPFIGRSQEISEITELLQTENNRLVTLFGQGGIGKTRLALEVGRNCLATEMFDGIYFVSLVGVDSADNLPTTIANALDLTLSGQQLPAQQVLDLLCDRKLLLILDNFEQLSDDIDWLLALLRAAPDVRLLLTSREQLNIFAEVVYLLVGLSTPPLNASFETAQDFDASRLFIERARRINPRFRLTSANWSHLVSICRYLEGLPLGIELAATWVQELGLTEIAANMAADLDFLETTVRDVAPHQRSVRHVYGTSWARLSAAEQNTLAQLSVMRGVFDTKAAMQIAQATPLTLRRLRHKSLVRSTGIGWLDMHELVRQFSAEILAQTSEQHHAASLRHAQLYLQRVAAYENAAAAEQQTLRETIRRSLDNVYAAWHWALENRALLLLRQCVNGMARYHFNNGLLHDGIAHMQAVASLFANRSTDTLTDAERELLGWALVQEGGIWSDLAQYERAIEVLNRAIEIPVDSEPSLAATIAYHRGRYALHTGDSDNALRIFQAGLIDARRGRDRHVEGSLLRDIGSVYRQRGDYVTFINYLEQALGIYEQLADIYKIQSMRYFLGFYTMMAGRYWAGLCYLLQAQSLNVVTQSVYTAASIEASLGQVYTILGQPEQALALFQPAFEQLATIGEQWRMAMVLIEMAAAQMALGKFTDSAESLQEADKIAISLNLTEVQAHVQLAQGYQLRLIGQLTPATHAFATAQQKMARLNRTIGVVEAQLNAAAIALEQGNRGLAATSVGGSLQYVATKRMDGAYQREGLYALAFELALELDTQLAMLILAQGQAFVQTVLNDIVEPAYRRSYQNRSAVRKLLQAS